MRHFFLYIILFFCFQLKGYSSDIIQNEVNKVAKTFILHNFEQPYSITIESIKAYRTQINSIPLYIVNLNPEGWILVSGDKNIKPVIGYNQKGNFEPEKNAEFLGVESLLNDYLKAINDKSGSNIIHHEWNELLSGRFTKTSNIEGVSPLIPVEWDQNQFYNVFCPVDSSGPGNHAYVGCVAIAMAQALSVYQYPEAGTGSISYNHDEYGGIILHLDKENPYMWDSMLISKPNEYIARFLYHCAVAVKMDFGSEGSGSFTRRVPGALKNNFFLSDSIRYVVRSEDDEAWKNMLIKELNAGRPIIYSGDGDDGEAGHAFNIDGVTSQGYFHLNWGWSGKYNGYFVLDNLRPGSGYNFTKNHEAVIGIRPPVFKPTDVLVSDTVIMTGTLANSPIAKLTIVDEAKNNEYQCYFSNDESGVDTSSLFFIDNDSIKLHADILDLDTNKIYTTYIQVIDKFENHYSEKLSFHVRKALVSSLQNISFTEDHLLIYPNPVHRYLNLRTDRSFIPGSISIYTPQGRLLLQRENVSHVATLDLSGLDAGIYILKVTNVLNDRSFTRRFVKQ